MARGRREVTAASACRTSEPDRQVSNFEKSKIADGLLRNWNLFYDTGEPISADWQRSLLKSSYMNERQARRRTDVVSY